MGVITTDELRLVISAEVDRAIRDMERFDSQIEETEKTAKAASVNWDKVSRSMMLFSAGVTAAGVASVKFAADIETQETAFGVLLGSVEKGTQLFSELKQFSASTPLQLQDITRGAQTLMAFGTEAGNVQKELRMLGDAAMGNAGKLDSLIRAYGKLQAKGRATLEELNMFTENGVPIMEQLARQTGATTEEVFKMVSAGNIGFADVHAAMIALTSDGGKFAGMMEKVSQTTSGKFSTAIDNLKLSAAELGKTLLPMANSVLDSITKVAQQFAALDEGTKKWIVTLGGIAAAAGPISKVGLGLAGVIRNKEKILGIAKTIGPAITNPWVLAGTAVATLTIASIKLARTWRQTRAIIEGGSSGDLGKDLELLSGRIDGARAKLEELRARERAAESSGGLVVFNPEELQEAEAALEHLLDRRQQIAEQLRAEEYQKRVEAGEILWMENAFKALDDAAGEQTKTWQSWFNEIAGTALDEGTTTGRAFASAYLQSLRTEVADTQVLADALGIEFDAAAKEAESIRGVLEKLFAIDPAVISEPFDIADESIKALVLRYRELTDGVETSTDDQLSLYDRLFDQIDRRMDERMEAEQAFALVTREISVAAAAGDQDRLVVLAAVLDELESILEIQTDIKQVAEEIGPLEAKFLDNWSPDEQAAAFGRFVRKVTSGYDDITSVMEEYSFAIDILKDTWNILSETVQHNLEVDLETMEASVEAEYQALQIALSNRESVHMEEIAALKEMYDKDVISYSEYLSEKAAIDEQYAADTAAEAEAYVAMKNELLRAEYEAALASFETNKQTAIAQAVISAAQGIMAAWALGPVAGAVGSLLIGGALVAQLAAINNQSPPAPPTYLTVADVTAATGADFITSGPTTILAGENPGGREHVRITPLSSQNIHGPHSGGDNYYISIGYLVGSDGIDEFIEMLDKRRPVLKKRGSYS